MLKTAHISNIPTNFSFYKDIYLSAINRSGLNYLNNEHSSIWHGRKSLSSIKECDIYTALYGGIHFYKLDNAFKNLDPKAINSRNIEINDYGCGQAFATLVLLENLLKRNFSIKSIKINLFDTSEIAIKNGSMYIYKLLNENRYKNLINIQKHIIDMNHIDKLENVKSKTSDFKFHLFSNILDIQSISLFPVTNFIKYNFKGVNYFVCISPSYSYTLLRMQSFIKNLDVNISKNIIRQENATIYDKIYKFRGGRKLITYPITRIEKQFIINL